MKPKRAKDGDRVAQEERPLVSKSEVPNQKPEPPPPAAKPKPTPCCNVPGSVVTISTCLLISLFGDSLLYAVLPVVHGELGKWGTGLDWACFFYVCIFLGM